MSRMGGQLFLTDGYFFIRGYKASGSTVQDNGRIYTGSALDLTAQSSVAVSLLTFRPGTFIRMVMISKTGSNLFTTLSIAVVDVKTASL